MEELSKKEIIKRYFKKVFKTADSSATKKGLWSNLAKILASGGRLVCAKSNRNAEQKRRVIGVQKTVFRQIISGWSYCQNVLAAPIFILSERYSRNYLYRSLYV